MRLDEEAAAADAAAAVVAADEDCDVAVCFVPGGDAFAPLWAVYELADCGGDDDDADEGADAVWEDEEEAAAVAAADGNRGGGTFMDGGGTWNLREMEKKRTNAGYWQSPRLPSTH